MTEERYTLLMLDESQHLTGSEVHAGWHFCSEFDGLLVGPGMHELKFCSCWPATHAVYNTVCRFDTDGDGNCANPTCRHCHPENFRPAKSPRSQRTTITPPPTPYQASLDPSPPTEYPS